MRKLILLLLVLSVPAFAECVFPPIDGSHATVVIYNPHYPHSRSTSNGHAGRIYVDNRILGWS